MSSPDIIEGMALNYPGTGPDYDSGRSHRCVVVKDDTLNGDVYLLPICTAHKACDTSCILNPGCPVLGLTKRSYVAYYAGKKIGRNALIKKLTDAEILHLGKLPDEIFANIIDGILSSLDVEPWFKNAVIPPKPKTVLNAIK